MGTAGEKLKMASIEVKGYLFFQIERKRAREYKNDMDGGERVLILPE